MIYAHAFKYVRIEYFTSIISWYTILSWWVYNETIMEFVLPFKSKIASLKCSSLISILIATSTLI